jgi:menaquinone-dependent protoporphyrinogen IX oxidase
MNGAIFFSGKYGSTEQYSKWIAEATGLPVFDINDPRGEPSKYDYLVLGSSILYFKLSIRKWVREHFRKLDGRAVVLFSVSGAGPSAKLDRWVANSMPTGLLSQMKHVGLRGRLDHSKVSWWVRQSLYIASLFNPNPEASKDERYGFDYMDKSSIEPIVEIIQRHQVTEAATDNRIRAVT